jgi:hypothetical protein
MPTARKIVVTNMKRREEGQMLDCAGVRTYKLVHELFKEEHTALLYYIGYVEGTRHKLQEQGIDPNTCNIFNEFNDLR